MRDCIALCTSHQQTAGDRDMTSVGDSSTAMSTESMESSHYGETMTTSEERDPVFVSSLLPFQVPVVVIAVLGIFANGFVLGSFRFINRANMTTAMMYVANQTTLDTRSAGRHFLDLFRHC